MKQLEKALAAMALTLVGVSAGAILILGMLADLGVRWNIQI